MWTRCLLKQNAKLALRGRYWKCFLVTLVVYLVSGGIGGIYTAVFNMEDRVSGSAFPGEVYSPDSFPSGLMLAVSLIALLSGLLSLCWAIFVASPLQVGCARYYMESRQAPAPYTTVMGIFRKPYGNVVEVQLLVSLKIILGSLIVIPGIYWSFCYALVPYLLAENPYLNTRRAMDLSREMMYGEKWRFFVLQLSFLGWYLLSLVTLGIGLLFLAPYIEATNAEFYAAMRAKVLAAGGSTPQELGGFMRHSV